MSGLLFIMWVWVLSFTILGTTPEHGRVAKYETKAECINALKLKVIEASDKGKILVGSCYYGKI